MQNLTWTLFFLILASVQGGIGFAEAQSKGAVGKLKWYFASNCGCSAATRPAVGTDGTIYESFDNGDVYAVGPNGKARW